MIRLHGKERPDHPYLHFEGATYTYGDLDARSSQVAAALASAGVGHGDRVAVLDKNTPLCLEVMFAAAKCGAVYVPVNWRLAPPEVAAVIADAEPSVFIAGTEFAPELAAVFNEQTNALLLVPGVPQEPFKSFASWVQDHEAADPGAELGSEEPALIHYTSGTTGAPKGVVLSNGNLLGRLGESAELWGYDADSVNLVVSPLFHIGGTGTFLLATVTGSTTVMLRMVEPDEILAAVDEHEVTNALLVPAIIGMLVETPGCEDVNWSTLRTLMYGASPISETILRRAMEVMDCDFIQLYGITENSGCLTYLAPEDHDPEGRPGLLRSCGRPLPWNELRVVSPGTLDPVETREVGEVAVRSPQVMMGYWRQPRATAEVVTEDGWFHTGDAGYLDEGGYLYLHDRIKDMIVSGGENIYPAEIENVIMRHPAVADAGVIGIPHEKWGEAPHAVVVLKEGREMDAALEQDIIESCRADLAGYKAPASAEAVAELPRNPAGKILKRELREAAWAGYDRRVG